MTEQQPQTASSSAPTHIAYNVRKAGEQAYWDRIGVAWSHKDARASTSS